MKCPKCAIETEGPENCTGCGAPLSGEKPRPSVGAGWWGVGAIGLAVAVGLALSGKTPEPAALPAAATPPGPFAVAAPSAAGLPAEPLEPRAQADGLFNAAMMASETGDAARARQALPQALAAYQAAGALDDDGVFHVATLHLALGDFPRAHASAELILARQPNHLLALSVAARATAAAGDAAAARQYNERLVAAYDTEVSKQLPEYLDHERMLPIQRDLAKQALGR